LVRKSFPRKDLRSSQLPNDEAIIRLVGASGMGRGPWRHHAERLGTNDEWAVARRYMPLETLARVTDNPTIRLSAVTA